MESFVTLCLMLCGVRLSRCLIVAFDCDQLVNHKTPIITTTIKWQKILWYITNVLGTCLLEGTRHIGMIFAFFSWLSSGYQVPMRGSNKCLVVEGYTTQCVNTGYSHPSFIIVSDCDHLVNYRIPNTIATKNVLMLGVRPLIAACCHCI